jgi:fructoselysine-6-P-deglycase FrlB-like protein
MRRIVAVTVLSALAALAGLANAQGIAEERERAYAEVLSAQKALEDARRRREQGVEPHPGERLGTVGGRSRLAEAYFERQKALEDEVRAAEQRLAEAYRRWNDLK